MYSGFLARLDTNQLDQLLKLGSDLLCLIYRNYMYIQLSKQVKSEGVDRYAPLFFTYAKSSFLISRLKSFDTRNVKRFTKRYALMFQRKYVIFRYFVQQ